jgi:outer membrane protein assembly factor BamB
VARLSVTFATLACVLLAACGGGDGRTKSSRPATTAAGQAPASKAKPARRSTQWPVFTTSRQRFSTGLTAAAVARLTPREVRLDGTVDSSPVLAGGKLIVTTTYGRTIALSPKTGSKLWEYTPPGISGWEGSAQITTATPAVAGNRVYAAAPDGRIRALRLSDGRAVRSWTMTRDPTHEKIASSIQRGRNRIYVTTGGYVGDAPPYQGHVVAIDTASGRIVHVWNSLCSDRHRLIVPRTCSASDSAIWARAGAVVEPSGRLLVATGNGPFNGRTNWGDSVIELNRDASGIHGTWTPPNQAQLESSDADLGSTAPALLNSRYAIQGGKDGVVRLLRLRPLRAVQSVSSASGGYAFTAPAIGRYGGAPYAFTADSGKTVAYRLAGNRLKIAWTNGTSGTSPILAGGLLYVFDPNDGKLNVYRPRTGQRVASLPAHSGHWNSPIVYDGTIALPVGNANDHSRSGTLLLYR